MCICVLKFHCKRFEVYLGCGCLSVSQEICFRARVIGGWYAELEHCIAERLITVTRYHIRNIEELQQELEKVEQWLYHLTMMDSMFQR